MKRVENIVRLARLMARVGRFLWRRKRLTLALAVALLIVATAHGKRQRVLLPQPGGLGYRRPGGAADHAGREPEAVQLPVQLPPAKHSTTERYAMTTMTLETTASVRRLEELVDRLLAALLGDDALADAAAASLTKTVHEARRLRQSGDLGGALAALADVDPRQATDAQLRWLYAEWLDIARRRFAGSDAMLYSPATGKAAVMMEGDDGTLETAAALGMRWPVGKVVSKRSLRGLKSLHKRIGGESWS